MILLTVAACFFCFQQVQCRKPAVNDFTQKETTEVRRFIYAITDYLLYEVFSVTDASPETVQFVRQMQKQMDMERITIRVRSLSGRAMLSVGRENAAAISIPYANTVLISEEWFNTLPEVEKKALVAHELTHIKNKHMYKSLALGLFTSFSSHYLYDKLMGILDIDSLGVKLFGYIIDNTNKIPFVERTLLKFANRLITWIVVAPPKIITLSILAAFIRHNELEADRVAALKFNNTKGVRDLMKRFKDMKDPFSRFGIRNLLYYVRKPMRRLFRTHPSWSKRIKAIEELDPKIRD